MSEQTEQINPSVIFDLKIYDPTFLIDAVKAISEIVEDATFSIDKEGLYFRGMDPSHVCLIDLISANADYEKYQVDKDGSFGVRIDELVKILKGLRKKDSLKLWTTDGQNLNIETSSSKASLRLIESSSYNSPIPRLSLNSKLSIMGAELNRILKQIHNVSEYVQLTTTDYWVKFFGKGDSGECTIKLEKGDPELIELDNKETSETTYSLEYVLAFLKHTCKRAMTLEYSQKMPLRIETKLDRNTRLHYYLAPRVEN